MCFRVLRISTSFSVVKQEFFFQHSLLFISHCGHCKSRKESLKFWIVKHVDYQNQWIKKNFVRSLRNI